MTAAADDDVYTGHGVPDAGAAARDGAAVAADLGDRYEVVRYLNRGGFATVWEAVDRVDGAPLAVKRLDPRVGRGKDFYRELRAMIRLDHPHVVRLVNFLEAGGTRYLILELCGGGSLRAAISKARRRGERCPEPRAAELVGQIARGLSAAHALGTAHRDLKPENVLFDRATPDPFAGAAKLADFGLAGVQYDDPDRGLMALTGSPAYMAPEQFGGTYGPASDVYALGVIAFELLTGDVPFAGTAEKLAYRHLREDPAMPADLPDRWRGLLPRMLAKDPAARPTAAEVATLATAAAPKPRPERPVLKPVAATEVRFDDAPTGIAARPGEFLLAFPDRVERVGPDGVKRTPLRIAGVTDVTVDRGGTAWLTAGARVVKWRETPRDVGQLPTGTDASFAFEDHGAARALTAAGDRVAKIDLDTGLPVWARDVPGGGLKRKLCRLPDGRAAVTDFADGGPGLRILSAAGDPLARIPLPGICWQLLWWPGGNRLALRLLTGAGFRVYRTDSKGGVAELANGDGAAGLCAGPRGGWLIGHRADGTAVGWDPDRRPRRLTGFAPDDACRGYATDGRAAGRIAGTVLTIRGAAG